MFGESVFCHPVRLAPGSKTGTKKLSSLHSTKLLPFSDALFCHSGIVE